MKKIYVSPDGNDKASGSKSAPLQTLEGVKNKIRKIKKNDPDEAIDVLFAGGAYDMASLSVTFTKEESGTEKGPITFRPDVNKNDPYDESFPEFFGGKLLDMSKAEKVTDPAILNLIIDPAARAGLYKLDIKELIPLLPDEHDGYAYNNPSFFRDNLPMYPARFPKKDTPAYDVDDGRWLLTDSIIHSSADYANAPFEIFTDYGVIDHIKHFWSEKSKKDVWLRGYLWHNWVTNIYKVSGFDYDRCTIKVDEGTHGNHFSLDDKKYRRFVLYNVLEEISCHEEYYIDKENGILYFYPEMCECGCNEIEDNIIFTMNRKPGMILDGAEYYNFEGLTFDYFTCNGVNVENTTHVTFDNCEFAFINGDAALRVANSTYFTLKNTRIYDTASSGLILYGGGNPKTFESGHIVIENNDMENSGYKRKCYSPCINTWDTVGLVIRNNKLHGNCNMVVFMEGIDITFEYNEIYDAVKDSDDAGAIYWGRIAHSIGTRIRYNFFHDIGHEKFSTQGIGAIYTDDNATSAEIYGNVFHNAALFGDRLGKQIFDTCNATLFFNAAQFAYTHDNIFLMGTPGETPMSDVGHYAILWWTRNALGAYVKEPNVTLGGQQHWRERLEAKGLYNGTKVNELWREHYKGTEWAPMFELLSEDNYLRGAKDENGKTYGIPDIQKKFENKEIDAETATKMFEDYTETVVNNTFGEKYVANCFEKNIIIGMADRFMVEKEHDSMQRTPHSKNMYITFDEAGEYFADYRNADYRLTEKGEKAVKKAMGEIDCPKTK